MVCPREVDVGIPSANGSPDIQFSLRRRRTNADGARVEGVRGGGYGHRIGIIHITTRPDAKRIVRGSCAQEAVCADVGVGVPVSLPSRHDSLLPQLRACADRLATFHYLSVLRTIKWAPHHSLIHSLPAY